MESKNPELLETKKRMVVTSGWGRGVGRWCRKGEMLVKWHKLPVRRGLHSGDLRYGVVTIVNNSVLYTGKLLRE